MMTEKRRLRTTVPTHRMLEGGGFPVRRPTPMGSLTSPFLLLDEMAQSIGHRVERLALRPIRIEDSRR